MNAGKKGVVLRRFAKRLRDLTKKVSLATTKPQKWSKFSSDLLLKLASIRNTTISPCQQLQFSTSCFSMTCTYTLKCFHTYYLYLEHTQRACTHTQFTVDLPLFQFIDFCLNKHLTVSDLQTTSVEDKRQPMETQHTAVKCIL